MASKTLEKLVSDLVTGRIRIVDLTVTLEPSTPVLPLPTEFGWGVSWPFSLETISRYDEKGPAWYWNNLKCGEHTGTHFDAPIHWVTGKDFENNATDTLPVDRFVVPAVVIDAVAEAEADPDFLMSIEFIRKWESEHGEIAEGSWVLYRTDWSDKLSSEDYLNMASDGSHTPGWDPSTITFLAEERGQASALEPNFPCHNMMHGANKCGLASLCNLDQLPPTGAVLIAAPLKIKDGSGSPARVLALVPQD